ncbi:MAG: PfkB family carbohydrate kinase [Tissierellia bacterium]|nr:PfkB family carbohydrate kinase [Tissierellia bacterium]
MKKVLLVGDIVSHGKIALSSMIPILSNFKLDISNLPTCIVSNTFDYKIAELHDLSSYMKNTINIWNDLGFRFDIIVTGFLSNLEQVNIIEELIEFHDEKPLIITDPIMGDDGELYHGLPDEIVNYMKEMINHTDILIPNATEAALLLDKKLPKEMTDEIANKWLEELHDRGIKEIVITSIKVEGRHYVYGIKNTGEKFRVEYDIVPYKFAGTGDIFASFVTAKIVEGIGIEEAVVFATEKLSSILKKEIIDSDKKVRDVAIEKYLDTINR